MKKKGTLVTFLLSLGLLIGFSAQAASVQLTATADGDVQSYVGNDDVDTTDTAIYFTQSGGLQRNAILEYDLSSIDDGAIILSATLEFTLTRFVSNLTGPAAIDIIAYSGDGVVDLADYDASGTQVVDTTTPTGGVAGDVRSFVFTDVNPLQLALAGDLLTLRIETDSFASIMFAALENGTYDSAKLNIEYSTSPVPVPPAIALMASGLALLGGMRRRRQAS